MPIPIRLAALLLILPIAIWNGVSAQATPELAADAMPLPPAPFALSAADQFGNRLFAHVAASSARTNALISPLSLDFAAALLQTGAQAEARKEWLAALNAPGSDDQQALQDLQSLRERLTTDATVDMKLVNGVWSSPATPLQPDYIKRVDEFLGAKAQSLDLTKPEALVQINEWFSKGTGGLIPHLFDKLPAQTDVVLGNALYFKGRWAHRFDPAQTSPGEFKKPSGAIQRSFMHQELTDIAYRETGQGQAVRLPFDGGHFEMIVVLPRAAITPQALIGKDGAGLAEWLDPGAYASRQVRLALPRLSVDAGTELLEPLRLLGLAAALNPSADYGALSPKPIHIDRILQKVVLKLDESGAEAAAATGAAMSRSAMPMPEFKTMTADHPFVVVLRHIESGALLVEGSVQDPGGA